MEIPETDDLDAEAEWVIGGDQETLSSLLLEDEGERAKEWETEETWMWATSTTSGENHAE